MVPQMRKAKSWILLECATSACSWRCEITSLAENIVRSKLAKGWRCDRCGAEVAIVGYRGIMKGRAA